MILHKRSYIPIASQSQCYRCTNMIQLWFLKSVARCAAWLCYPNPILLSGLTFPLSLTSCRGNLVRFVHHREYDCGSTQSVIHLMVVLQYGRKRLVKDYSDLKIESDTMNEKSSVSVGPKTRLLSQLSQGQSSVLCDVWLGALATQYPEVRIFETSGRVHNFAYLQKKTPLTLLIRRSPYMARSKSTNRGKESRRTTFLESVVVYCHGSQIRCFAAYIGENDFVTVEYSTELGDTIMEKVLQN